MKVTRRQLRRIINEELNRVLREDDEPMPPTEPTATKPGLTLTNAKLIRTRYMELFQGPALITDDEVYNALGPAITDSGHRKYPHNSELIMYSRVLQILEDPKLWKDDEVWDWDDWVPAAQASLLQMLEMLSEPYVYDGYDWKPQQA